MWKRVISGSGGGGVELNPTLEFKRIASMSTESFTIDSTKDYVFVGCVASASNSYTTPYVVYIPNGATATADLTVLSTVAQTTVTLSSGILSVYNGNYGRDPFNASLVMLD